MSSEEKQQQIKFNSHLDATKSILDRLKKINNTNNIEKDESTNRFTADVVEDVVENVVEDKIENVVENVTPQVEKHEVSFQIDVPETLDVNNQYEEINSKTIKESEEEHIFSESEEQKLICRLTDDCGLFQIATAQFYALQHTIKKVIFYYEGIKDVTLDDCKHFEESMNKYLNEPINVTTKEEAFGINRKEILEVHENMNGGLLYDSTKHIWLNGCFKSSRYFSKEFAQRMFNFAEADKIISELYENLSDAAAIYFIKNKESENALSVDDVLAIRKKFPEDDFIIFSDNLKYCKKKFSKAGFQIAEYNNSDLDDFIINIAAMRQCMAVIMDNSIYGWWSAFLSQRPGHITVYKKGTEQKIGIPQDKSWITFETFLGL